MKQVVNLLAAVFYVVVLKMLWLKLVIPSFVAVIVRAKSARFTVKHFSERYEFPLRCIMKTFLETNNYTN